MARMQMTDGMIVETDNARGHWNEGTQWDGNNNVSLATGSQWDHEELYRSRRGRYYIWRSSQWQGSLDSAEWISNEEACRWLLANGYTPDDVETDDSYGWPADLSDLIEELTD